VIRLLAWCESREISLRGEHVPGVDNQVADALSRGVVQPTASRRIRGSLEWQLQPKVCRSIFHRLDRPHIDLFASIHNYHLSSYFSWEWDARSQGRDVLSQDWSGLLAYASPPIALIPRLLLKVTHAVSNRVLRVAPWWPCQGWFSRLLDLLVSEPVRLPISPDLLCVSATRQRVPFHTIEGLKLTVWSILADPSLRQAFLKRLPIPHRRQGDLQPEQLMLRGFRDPTDCAEVFHVSPFSASVVQVADFLTEVFSGGAQALTVLTYGSAIGAIYHGFSDGTAM